MTKTTATATKATKKPVTKAQHKFLAAILKAGTPLSRKNIMDTGYDGNSVNLKPIIEALKGAKLISEKAILVDPTEPKGKKEASFDLTAAGKKVAAAPVPMPANGSLAHANLPKIGGTFTKNFKGAEVTVTVMEDGFKIGKETYSSLTAAAKAVRGSTQEVNGWAFFGLTKKAE